jgi:glycosyltransferase involved in cell wall biosynthesis
VKFVVAQLGARMHYAVPRALYFAGMLERLYTDVYASRGLIRAIRLVPTQFLPASLMRLAGRIPLGVPPNLISSFPLFGIAYARPRLHAPSVATKLRIDVNAGRRLCELAIRGGFGGAAAVYTYNSAGLELLRVAKKRGLRTVMEQTIAPFRMVREILETEEQIRPGWSDGLRDGEMDAVFADREAEEWDLADIIVCGSAFVRDGIESLGGPVERCVVVPYGVDGSDEIKKREASSAGRKLRVLTVGEIGIRKGSLYVLSSAKTMAHFAHFRMIGSVRVSDHVEAQLRQHVEILGPVPRSEMNKHYAWADVFLLPSLCEGSATVVYEALAAGIPVICTPNTGSVVRDGLDGFIVPVRNVDAITGALMKLASDPRLLIEMSRSALVRGKQFTAGNYGRRLIKSIAVESGLP